MNLIILQVTCLLTIFSVITVCGLIPVFIVQRKKGVHFSETTFKILSLCNCIAAGVFIGMCFLGLMPFAFEKFDEIKKNVGVLETSFPLAEFVIILGFFLILFIEQIILKCKLNFNSIPPTELRNMVVTTDDETHTQLLNGNSEDSEVSGEINTDCCIENATHVNHASNHGHSHEHVVNLVSKSSGLKFFILLLAVSIHSLFEGMALGLQQEQTKLWRLFIAVLLHEALVAFALGVNVSKQNQGMWSSCKYILLFTITIPCGMVIGLLVGTTPGIAGLITSAILQSITAGIFIYVTFMELIPEEFSNGKDRLQKVMYIFIGFMLMAVLSFVLKA